MPLDRSGNWEWTKEWGVYSAVMGEVDGFGLTEQGFHITRQFDTEDEALAEQERMANTPNPRIHSFVYQQPI